MVTSMGGSAPKCINAEVIYPAFLTGVDLVKKKVEFKRNKIKITDDSSFYKIKKHPKVLAQELEKLAKGEKEGKYKELYPQFDGGAFFSIDCIHNYELIRELCSFGSDLIVLSPEKIRTKIKESLQNTISLYSKFCSNDEE